MCEIMVGGERWSRANVHLIPFLELQQLRENSIIHANDQLGNIVIFPKAAGTSILVNLMFLRDWRNNNTIRCTVFFVQLYFMEIKEGHNIPCKDTLNIWVTRDVTPTSTSFTGCNKSIAYPLHDEMTRAKKTSYSSSILRWIPFSIEDPGVGLECGLNSAW